MDKQTELIFESFEGASRTERRINNCDDRGLGTLLDEMAPLHSASVAAKRDGDVLIIGASDGAFTATLVLGNGRVFNMLSDKPVDGTLARVVGGQSIDLPRRYILTLGQVREVLRTFVRSGSVNAHEGWEKQ